MECTDIRRHLDEYIDNECAAAISQAIAGHLQDCPECRAEYEARQALHAALSALPPQELPFDFAACLEERLRDEKQVRSRRKPLWKQPWMRALELCACVALVICAVGLGGRVFSGAGAAAKTVLMSPMAEEAAYDAAPAETPMSNYSMSGGSNSYSYNTYDMPAGAPAPEPASAAQLAEGEDGIKAANDQRAADDAEEMERKIIMNWYLNLKVTDFDAAFGEIERIAAAYNGYVVSGSSYNNADSIYRNGYISIRVDAVRADAAVADISSLGQVENSDFSSQDVTGEYYDIAARLLAYQAQEARLLELYDRAETIKELLEIESQLAEARAEIESLQGTINYYDQLTALSLIEVNLYTPSSYTQNVEPKGWAGFAEKLGNGFLSGLNNTLDFLADLIVWLARALPALVIIAAVIILLTLAIKRRRKHSGS